IRRSWPTTAPAGQRVPEDDAVGSDSRKRAPGEGREVAADTIERVMRERVRDTIERIVAEELEAALGAGRLSARDAIADAHHESRADDDHDASRPAGDG